MMRSNKQAILITIGLTAFVALLISDRNSTRSREDEAQSPFAISDSNYRIVYFTSVDENLRDLLSPANVQRALNASVVTTWAEVLDLDRTYGLDALILGEDIIYDVNREELSQMYQSAIVIAVFNTYSPDLENLLSDECIGRDGWMDGSEPYKNDFYVIVSRLNNGGSRIQEHASNQKSCNGNSSPELVEGFSGVYTSKAQNELASAADLDVFAQVLLLEIQTIHSYKAD